MTSDETRPDRDALREQIADAVDVYGLFDPERSNNPELERQMVLDAVLAVVEPALAQRDAEQRAERDAVHADLVAILAALGVGGHARPYSSHDVVHREILPAIAATHPVRETSEAWRATHAVMPTPSEWNAVVKQRDEARRVLAAVEALCDEALEANRPPNATNSEVVWLVADLRAALAGDQP